MTLTLALQVVLVATVAYMAYNSINGAYLCEDCANLEGEE